MVCLRSLLLSALACASLSSALRTPTSNSLSQLPRSAHSLKLRRTLSLASLIESTTTYISNISAEVNTELEARVPELATLEAYAATVVAKVEALESTVETLVQDGTDGVVLESVAEAVKDLLTTVQTLVDSLLADAEEVDGLSTLVATLKADLDGPLAGVLSGLDAIVNGVLQLVSNL